MTQEVWLYLCQLYNKNKLYLIPVHFPDFQAIEEVNIWNMNNQNSMLAVKKLKAQGCLDIDDNDDF